MKSTTILVLIALVIPSVATPQVAHSSISGVVTDPSDRRVAGAVVTLADSSHGFLRTARTDASGYFILPQLEPSTYRLSIAAGGFETLERHEIRVAVNAELSLDLRLTVSGGKQSLQVPSTTTALQTESGELGAVLDQDRLARLPLNRRDFLQLALLTPGVAPPVEDSELSTRGSFAMHAGGAREEYNNFLLDGVDNNDSYVNRYVVQPPVDTIQEFKIATNSYSAEYGRSAGGQVNVITRRGSNDTHGFFYDYLRNRVLDARNFFDGADAPKLIRNQFGGGAGGALLRDRLFYFANVDVIRSRQGTSRLASVPSAAERAGDFTNSGQTPVDPFTGQPFPDGRVPDSRISPVGRKIAALFPVANLQGNSGNYLGQPTARDDQSQLNFRVDYHLTAADLITVRYSYGDQDLFEPYAEGTDAVPGYGDYVRDKGHNAMVHYQKVLSPTTINSIRFGFNRYSRRLLPENYQTDGGNLLGVDWLQVPQRAQGLPSFTVAGYSRLGDITSLPIIRANTGYQILESLSTLRGRHALKIGGEIRQPRLDGTLDLLARGSLSFSGFIAGSGMADLLLGFPSFGLQSRSNNPIHLRSTSYNAYVQDDWKLANRFTLTLGLRYEYNVPAYDPGNNMTTFDFTTGKLVQVGTAGVPRSGINPDRNNFAPRLGFAWNPSGNFTLRGGYGIYYDAGMFTVSSAQYYNPPQFNLLVFFPTQTSLLTLQNPFPTGGGFAPPASLNILGRDSVTSYLQHWSFSGQTNIRELGTLSVAYAGSKGTHLVRARDINQPPPGPGDVQERRPLPAYSNFFYIETAANSNYHSLQVALDRPLGRGFSLWAAYTLGRSMDDASAFLATKADPNFPQNSSDLRPERGYSSFDVRHRLVAAYIWSLPKFNVLTRNTELRGITTLQSGSPFTPLLRFDNSNTGNTGGNFGSDRPDLIGDPSLSNRGAAEWFNTAAFAVPQPYHFGTAGRNILRGPATVSFDVSLARRFALTERAALLFEAQAFNLINHTNFLLPEIYADEPTSFGRIFAAKSPRQLQLALRFTF